MGSCGFSAEGILMSVLAEAHSGTTQRERERENLPTLPVTRTTEMAMTADVAIKIASALID